MSDASTTLQVAQDLREIQRLADMLADQAYHHADDHDMPGGEAMAMLAPVANLEAWANKLDTAERMWLDGDGPEPFSDDSDDWAPPLQLLTFWSELWRVETGQDDDETPTIQGEAKWLADNLAWSYEREPRFEDYAKDVHRARRILEATLIDGDRSVLGVQCPSCSATSLVRVTEQRLTRPCAGHGPSRDRCPYPRRGCCDRGGLQERWECPVCRHSMQLADYESAVMRDYIANAPYLRAEHVERRTLVKPGTVRQWASRGHVRTRKDGEGRVTYCVEDVKARANLGEKVSESA